MSEASTPNPDRPRGRYGDQRRVPTGRLIVVGIIGLVVVCTAYIFVQMNRVSTPDVTASAAGWDRVAGREDDVFVFTLDVTREEPARDAYCVIYALDYDMNEVGRRDVLVPGGEGRTVRMDVPVRTRARAVAGDVYGCSTELPALLDR